MNQKRILTRKIFCLCQWIENGLKHRRVRAKSRADLTEAG